MSIAQAPARTVDDVAWEGVFPLPLTPMEGFLLTDTRPGYPMMCDIQLELEGTLDREVFNSALAAALVRNPLFCSIVARDPKVGWAWIPSDQPPIVDWAPEGTPLGERYDETIDMGKEIGLRVWVRQGENRATVLLHFHHACGDALGLFSFIEDLLALYSSLCPGGPAVALRPLEPQRLQKRGLASIPKRRWYHHPFDLLIGIREGLRFFLTAPTPLGNPSQPSDGKPARQAPMLSRRLGPEVTAKLRAVATASRGTVNDLLLCDLFMTLRRWNEAHPGPKRCKWLRILMPQNLRAQDAATPTANIMSFAFLTRRLKRCESTAALLPALHAETEAIRRNRLSVFFLGSLAAALSAGVLDKFLASKICFSTAVLSNFGFPSRRFVAHFPQTTQGLVVGNVVFRSLSGVPPLRPGTRAAFAAITNRDGLTLTLKCDPQLYSPIDAARLLDEYVSQVTATASSDLPGQKSS